MNKAFIIMPFSEAFVDIYNYLILEALESVGYDVKRADDIKSQNNILGDIIEGIISSDLIVADLTDSNPNVYYELGIAHAMGKRVILLTQSIEELPFDLRSYRVVAYDSHFSKMNQAKKELYQLALEALENQLPFGNPVKDFGNIAPRNHDLPASIRKMVTDQEVGELGLLDYRIKLEDGFEKLSLIIQDVGDGLLKVNPEVVEAAAKMSSGDYGAKELKQIVMNLASHFNGYGLLIKPKNVEYKILLKDVESSLEYLLTRKVDEESGAEGNLLELVETLVRVEQSAFNGKQEFINLVEGMDSMPKIEQNFDREKVFMSTELKEFISNIDQTIAVLSRASRLGKSLIEKVQKKNNGY